jgi:uncharacterized Zn finger protein (UPF0148 family)
MNKETIADGRIWCPNCRTRFHYIVEVEENNHSPQNEALENGGSINQGSSLAFELQAHRSSVPAGNHKSKEAPKITNKYGRNTEIYNRVDETARSRENIAVETDASGSSEDTHSTKQSQGMCEFPNSPMVITKLEDTTNSTKQELNKEID